MNKHRRYSRYKNHIHIMPVVLHEQYLATRVQQLESYLASIKVAVRLMLSVIYDDNTVNTIIRMMETMK